VYVPTTPADNKNRDGRTTCRVIERILPKQTARLCYSKSGNAAAAKGEDNETRELEQQTTRGKEAKKYMYKSEQLSSNYKYTYKYDPTKYLNCSETPFSLVR
jgi:hypothetical protein